MRPSLLLHVALLAAATLGAAPAGETFVGVISDDMCARNHASMRMGPTDAACAHACVDEHDGSYVLVDDAHVYTLSDQRAAKAFAGGRAKVIGTLDAKTSTITVTSITAP
jgi:hypothetical protein